MSTETSAYLYIPTESSGSNIGSLLLLGSYSGHEQDSNDTYFPKAFQDKFPAPKTSDQKGIILSTDGTINSRAKQSIFIQTDEQINLSAKGGLDFSSDDAINIRSGDKKNIHLFAGEKNGNIIASADSFKQDVITYWTVAKKDFIGIMEGNMFEAYFGPAFFFYAGVHLNMIVNIFLRLNVSIDLIFSFIFRYSFTLLAYDVTIVDLTKRSVKAEVNEVKIENNAVNSGNSGVNQEANLIALNTSKVSSGICEINQEDVALALEGGRQAIKNTITQINTGTVVFS